MSSSSSSNDTGTSGLDEDNKGHTIKSARKSGGDGNSYPHRVFQDSAD